MKSHRYWSFFRFIAQHSKAAITVPIAVLVLLCAGTVHGQSTQCYSYDPVKKTWVYNAACAGTPSSPWQIALGKIFTVNNSLTLSGTDNAQLNIGTGGTLGTAAFANSNQFQPAGGGANTSVYYGSALTIGTGTDYIDITVSTGLSFSSNMWVLAAYVSNPTQYMYGYVHTYDATTGALKITVPATGSTGGSGTHTGWNISVAGAIGPVGAAGASGAPVGSMFMWPASTPPTDYILAQGQCLAQSGTYNALYLVYGSTWDTAASRGNVGTDCTAGNFGVPNMQARLPIGAGQGNTAESGGTGTNRVLGTVGGAETHTQTQAELATHAHSVYDPGHAHVTPGYWDSSGGNGYGGGAYWWNAANSSTQYSTTGISLYNAGSSSPMTIMDPFAVVNYIIRYQ